MSDEGQCKDLHQTVTTCVLMFLRIESVLPPSHIRLKIRPSVDEFESTFSPGEGMGAVSASSAISNFLSILLFLAASVKVDISGKSG